MISPPYLKRGDKIGIVGMARKMSREELQPAIDILTNWGFEVVLGKNIFEQHNQFAGTDVQRAGDLQNMLDDTGIKAVISSRGGYGTLRIIDMLDFSSFQKNPKWIVGYSDITVLHSHIHTLGIQTLHATMPVNFTKDEETTETLRKALMGEKLSYSYESPSIQRNGNTEGELTGGNLSLLYALNASKSDIDTKGKILFIEDLDEYLYHIDRMMLSLKRSGKLDQLKGLVVGGFSDMKDNTIPFGQTAHEIIMNTVKEYNYPVCFDFPAGHTTKNLALKLGARARLMVKDNSVTLEF